MSIRTIASAIARRALAAASASAHVTLSPDRASADSMLEARFDVGHGCDGAATVALRAKIPEGVFAVKPQMKAGWRFEIKRRELAQSGKNDRGHAPTTVVDEGIGSEARCRTISTMKSRCECGRRTRWTRLR